jgi:integrase
VIYPAIVLRKPKQLYSSDEEVSVVVFYYFKGKKAKFSTSVKVRIKDWNSESDTPVRRSDSAYQTKNLKIREVELAIRKEVERIQLDDLIPFPSLVRSRLERVERKREKQTKQEFDFFLLLDEFYKSVDLNTDITASTKKTIYSILNQVVAFLKVEKSAKHFFIDQLDEAFIEEYQWYCVNQKKLSNATIHSHFRKVRSFVNWAKRRGYTEYNFPRLKISIGENDIVFLQRDEILKLFQFDEFDYSNDTHRRYTTEYFEDDLKGIKGAGQKRTYTNWEVYKDMLIFGCGVGCRFGDLVSLKLDNVKYKTKSDPSEYIRFTMAKTQKEVKIPFNQLTYAIYKKYSKGKTIDQYIFPLTPHGNLISNQKFNENIKLLSKIVGLNRRVVKKRYVGRDVKAGTELSQPICDIISSHIVRRTFIREGVNSNLPYHIIRSMSGHTDDKVFKSYFNTLTEEIERGMEKMFVFDLKRASPNEELISQSNFETATDGPTNLTKYRAWLEQGLISRDEFLDLLARDN